MMVFKGKEISQELLKKTEQCKTLDDILPRPVLVEL